MPRHPYDGLRGGGSDGVRPPGAIGDRQPFWARAHIDGAVLDVVVTLVDALASRWVADDLARQFGRSVATAAAGVLTGGEATVDLWEEPGRLVCHVTRTGAPDAVTPRPDPRRLRVATPVATPAGSGIVVDRSPGRVSLVLPVPFE